MPVAGARPTGRRAAATGAGPPARERAAEQVCVTLVRSRAARGTGGDPHAAAIGWQLQQRGLGLAPMLRLCVHVLRRVASHPRRRWRPSPSLRAFLVEYAAVPSTGSRRAPSRARGIRARH